MRMKILHPILAAWIFAAIWPAPAAADDWPAWRGPAGTGVTQETKLPLKWSETENVRWRIKLPQRGNSTPIVWGDRIFLTQPLERDKKRTLMCFDRKRGKLLWQQDVSYTKSAAFHRTNPPCSSSPVTDGKRVIVWHGSAGLFCYDFSGKELWRRELGPVEHMWGFATSPVLYKDLCILQFACFCERQKALVRHRTPQKVGEP